MGKRGPAPKPPELRVLEGNPGKRRLPKGVLKPTGTAAAPDHLDEHASAAWARILGAMPPGFFTAADESALAAYCQAVTLHRQAIIEIRESGAIAIGEKGTPFQSPWVSILNTQAKLIATLGTRLGLDPAARASLKAPEQDQPQSRFGNLVVAK